MTESEWLASTDPMAMLRRLSPWDNKDTWDARKLRLWCVACCYYVSPELGRDAEQCVEWKSGPARDAANWAMAWAGDQKVPTAAERASLLRCVLGNPFHAVNVDLEWGTTAVLSLAEHIYNGKDFGLCPVLADALEEGGCPADEMCERCGGSGGRMLRATDKVRSAPGQCPACVSGRIPNPLLLHLRNPGPHYRGCWALDLILGKE